MSSGVSARWGCLKDKDLIRLAWQRTKPKPAIPLKAFRSISATLLESHASYGRYKTHFLGHSPKSIADKHTLRRRKSCSTRLSNGSAAKCLQVDEVKQAQGL